jgi:hypothetical protein
MDLVLSLMPLHLIRNLSRPTSEKILISFLMSLGLVATVLSGVKIAALITKGGDPLQKTVNLSTYASLEEIVGIIACSAPCLKSFIEQILKRYQVWENTRISSPNYVVSVEEMVDEIVEEKQNKEFE